MAKKELDYSLIKKPYQKTSFTTEQLREFIKCADPNMGSQYFLNNYYYVQHPTLGKMLYKAYAYQEGMLDTIQNSRKSILLCGRQLGKTTTIAGYLLQHAMFSADKTILIAAHRHSFATEIMSRIKYAYEFLPDFLRAGVTEYNKQSVAFENGSRIIAQTTTPTTGRGYSVSVFYVDEFSSVPNNIQKEFWASISPSLSTGGKVIISSTPLSNEDQFAQIWNDANKTVDEFGNTIPEDLGANGFRAFKAIWSEHPDRDDEWARNEKISIGEERFLREHACEFITDEETLINSTKLSQLSGIEPLEKMGQVRWYAKPKKGNMYLVALDPSLGTGGDPSAIQVVEAGTNIQIAEWTHNKTTIEQQVRLLKEITGYLVNITENSNDVYYTVENNSIGEAVLVAIRDVGEENIPGTFLSEPVKLGQSRKFRKGFCTTNTSKLTACAKLKQMVESGKLQIKSKKLISELKTFISVGNTYKAKIGETDDLVTSMLTIVRMMVSLQNYIPSMAKNLQDDNENSAPLPFIMVNW